MVPRRFTPSEASHISSVVFRQEEVGSEPCVVDQDADRAQVGLGGSDGGSDRGGRGHVHLVSGAVDLGRHLVALGGVQVAHRHPGTLRCQPPAGGGADAACAPGDQGNSSLEPHGGRA